MHFKRLLIVLIGAVGLCVCYFRLVFHFKTTIDLTRTQENFVKFNYSSEITPLLTIFTTVKEVGVIQHHKLSTDVVMSNWPSFRPLIRPVVFLNFTDSPLAQRFRDAGWEILPMTRVNSAGTPFLRDMYQAVFDRFESRLYGFANGDLIFNDGLVRTVSVVCEQSESSLKNNILLTGIRTNVDVDLKEMTALNKFQGDQLAELVKKSGKIFHAGAVDYFFITKQGCSLKWPSLLDVVIGRPAYGTYLVAVAADQGVNVIDTTATILAVHLSEKGVVSHGEQNPDGQYNRKLIGSRFNHKRGFPGNLKLFTRFDKSGNVQLENRR